MPGEASTIVLYEMHQKKRLFFTGRMEPRALARVTLVATALLTGATGFLGKHTLVTASTRAFRRAAAKPTTRTAAHTMPDRLHNT